MTKYFCFLSTSAAILPFVWWRPREIRFPRGPIAARLMVYTDGTRWKINGGAGWWVKLALFFPISFGSRTRRRERERERVSSSSLREKERRIDDFLFPFRVFESCSFFFFSNQLVCIIHSGSRRVAFTACWHPAGPNRATLRRLRVLETRRQEGNMQQSRVHTTYVE